MAYIAFYSGRKTIVAEVERLQQKRDSSRVSYFGVSWACVIKDDMPAFLLSAGMFGSVWLAEIVGFARASSCIVD